MHFYLCEQEFMDMLLQRLVPCNRVINMTDRFYLDHGKTSLILLTILYFCDQGDQHPRINQSIWEIFTSKQIYMDMIYINMYYIMQIVGQECCGVTYCFICCTLVL